MFTIKNMSLPSNWPYEEHTSEQGGIIKEGGSDHSKIPRYVKNPQKSQLPLGLKVFRLASHEPAEQVLSHHFVPNNLRPDHYRKLDSIISLGEYEETEQRNSLDTPQMINRRRPGSLVSVQPNSPTSIKQSRSNTPTGTLQHQAILAHQLNSAKKNELEVPARDMAMAVMQSPRRSAAPRPPGMKQINGY